jgi:very-short-patch-repair endonuclease
VFLEREGFQVLRFWNNDVLTNPRGVFDVIERALKSPLP